ncbi:MAG: hypothetical protein IT428_09300 [Planctomycetaceae bacterium]|nr:hypothetical protein [Planctomycetaceae bacterium]
MAAPSRSDGNPAEASRTDRRSVDGAALVRRPRSTWIGPCIALMLLVGICGVRSRYRAASAGEPNQVVSYAFVAGTVDSVNAADRAAESKPSDGTDDETLRIRIVGAWTRQYSGKWNLEIRSDGTGTMVVEPDRFWSLLVGPRVTIRIEWRVENGLAVCDSIDGEPKSSFEAAMTFWKRHQERRVVELNDERFVYRSDDGKSNSVWNRATAE